MLPPEPVVYPANAKLLHLNTELEGEYVVSKILWDAKSASKLIADEVQHPLARSPRLPLQPFGEYSFRFALMPNGCHHIPNAVIFVVYLYKGAEDESKPVHASLELTVTFNGRNKNGFDPVFRHKQPVISYEDGIGRQIVISKNKFAHVEADISLCDFRLECVLRIVHEEPMELTDEVGQLLAVEDNDEEDEEIEDCQECQNVGQRGV